MKILYVLLFLMIYSASYSQENKTDNITYLDINETPTNKENAKYYEFKTIYKGDVWKYQKYFIYNPTKAQLVEKYFYDGDLDKQGKYISFRKDGSKLSEGYYTDNLKYGPWKKYFIKTPDSLMPTVTYLKYKTTFKNDVKSGKFKEYYPSGILKGEGQYKDNEFVGECKWYHKNNQLSSLEIYHENGSIIEITQWDKNGIKKTKKLKPNNDLTSQKKAVRLRVQKIITNIKKNYYKTTNGKITVAFKVDIEGKIILKKIYSSPEISEGFILKVKKTISKSKKGKPIYYHNQPTEVHLAIRFNMHEKRTTTRTTATKRRY